MKRLIALILCLLLSIPTVSLAIANPSSLDAPINLSVFAENGDVKIRWTVPQSITDYLNDPEKDGYILYCMDYKIDNGSWHYGAASVTDTLYDSDSPLQGYVDNLSIDEANAQESFLIPEMIGAGDEYDFTNHTYYFRMRFYLETEGVTTYVTSPWSNTASIGKGVGASMFTRLDAPANLKVELKYDSNQTPYFHLTWTNPQSVLDINKSYPIEYKIDFKVGSGKWFSEVNTHDWWGGSPIESSCDFHPIEKQLVDAIQIEENTYYFRILYSFETMDLPHVYSGFSNIVSLGTPPFYSKASDYATDFLDQAEDLGIVTPRMQGKDMTQPITREEFAEIAVKFYEMVTGEAAVPVAVNPFKDCNNAEVLKALNLKITAGTGNGTTFEPNARLLRQQMATMITNTLRACFTNFSIDVTGQADFKDQNDFAAYAIKPAKFMAKYGITAGDGKGNFVPNNYCTRQEAIIFLVKSYTAQDQYIK